MDISFSLSWIFLGLFLVAMIYTMIVIREEKASYKDNARAKDFGPYVFPVPSWWSCTTETESLLVFERTDTRYDWKAQIFWLTESLPSLSIEERFIEILKQKHLEFDEINSVIHEPESFKQHPLVQSGRWDICRVEGTATLSQVERVYYDAFLIRDLVLDKYLYCESKSSVLNGLVEGPYFEEMMSLVELSSSAEKIDESVSP